MADQEALLVALDHIEIQKVIALYAQGQDSHQRGDNDILLQWDRVFTSDAMVDYGAAGAPMMHYRDLAVWMRGKNGETGRMSNYSAWQHMLSIPVIDLDGDIAHARTDFMAVHMLKAGMPQSGRFDGCGAFLDTLVRTELGWRIKYRRAELYFGVLLAGNDMDVTKSRGI